jgi:dTMP kinase
MQAKFIVLEGIDGAGTTTQVGLLAAALRERALIAHATREPSDGAIGALLRRMLTKALSPPSHPHALALLFAADRLDHVGSEVSPRLARGEWVVSDRYDYSSIAYQSVAPEAADAIQWLRELNRHAPRPTLTIVLDVRPEVARARRLARDVSRELFDDDALQRQLAAFYLDIERHFPGDQIAHVDANRGVDEVARDVLALALA